jgi:2-polyprenyl-3-methyl-5-hydroxy-6-metoxy-1,4-benzoquinol methylase
MNTFDERAKDWDSDPAKVERARIVAEAIRAKISPSENLDALEYGCGTGLLSMALQNDFVSITLADTSQGMLDVLGDKIHAAGLRHFHPLLLDLTIQPPPPIRIDTIFSLMTMHHVIETRVCLENFWVMLKPGGRLFIADLDREDGSFHGQEVNHVHRGFERAELKVLVEDTGFENILFSTVFHIRKIIAGHEKTFPVFLMSAFKPR